MQKSNGTLKVWGWITTVLFMPVGFVIALVLLSRGERKQGGSMLAVMGGIVVFAVASSGGTPPAEQSRSSNESAASGSDTERASTPKAKKQAAPNPEKKPSCGSRATDDCTPRVGQDGRVRVDALYWNVTGVETASEIGDQEYGLGEKANGMFVVVNLKVRSAKSESVTIMDNAVGRHDRRDRKWR